MQICDFTCLVDVPTPSCFPLYVRCAARRAAWFSDFQTRVSFRDTTEYAIPSTYFFFFFMSRFSLYTQLIAEMQLILLLFFSIFCQLSRLAFISNRSNGGVSGKPINLN